MTIRYPLPSALLLALAVSTAWATLDDAAAITPFLKTGATIACGP